MIETVHMPEKDAVKEAAVLEKRHWVRLTKTCNNRCLFCLDKDMHTGEILRADEIRDEIARGAAEGGERLILSGGEPTIHPDFIEFIEFGLSAGFKRVQTISNGRMFAYRNFADAAMEAGLSEATFSIHGHTPELHDYLVGVPGAFSQSYKGILNLIGRCVVNIDIVINKQNVRHVSDIMEFFIDRGIHEFDLLHIVPFGNTYPENKDILFYDIAENMPYLRKAFDHSRTPDRFIWTNRFPIHYLEGNEILIQDPHKLYDEVNGRRQLFDDFTECGTEISCFGERCRYCFIEKFCSRLIEMKRRVEDRDFEFLRIDPSHYKPVENIDISDFRSIRLIAESPLEAAEFIRNNHLDGARLFLNLKSYDGFDGKVFPGLERVILSSAEHCEIFHPYEADHDIQIHLNVSTGNWLRNNVSAVNSARRPALLSLENHELLSDAVRLDIDARAFFDTVLFENAILLDMPFCIGPGLAHSESEPALDHYVLRENGTIDIERYAENFIVCYYYSKSVRCRDCMRYENCRGLHVNYLRNFGFAQQQPIRANEKPA